MKLTNHWPLDNRAFELPAPCYLVEIGSGVRVAFSGVPNDQPVLTMAEQKELERLRAQDQREIKALKKELQRKEKAMAEMAALLVLRKKWEAFCSEEEEG